MTIYDAVIVGGGHNGLVCACDLAAHGLAVRIVERRPMVGGAAVTEEFHPGFRNSTASYTVGLLHRDIVRDLRLHEHGLRIVRRPFSNFLPLPDDGYLKIGGGIEATQREVAKFSTQDAARLPAWYAMLDGVVALVRTMLTKTPPSLGPRDFASIADWWSAWDLGRRMRRMDLPHKRDLMDLFTKSAGDVLDNWFESAAIKAAFGFDSMVGHYASPYFAGSAYVLLHHVFGEVDGHSGVWGHAIGGMGSITQAMAKEAAARGVETTVDTPVARVVVDGPAGKRRATGVVLEDGTRIAARRVVSNVHPQRLFLSMIDDSDLPTDFVARIKAYRSGSGTLRMNVALSSLPDFTALPGARHQPHHESGIVMAPSLHYMETAWMDARRDGWGGQPIVEMLIPSTVDPTLAPEGMHVASLFCQHFAPKLEASSARERYVDGWADDLAREDAADCVIATVDRFAPGFAETVIARQVHTPLDLERKFGLVGGDIFHGALSLDQLFSARPVLGHADYRSPIDGLYLCGSGNHPGGGVTGLPGRNAAREILRDR
ncbi:MAG: NAD(P)/FAD-dependent oxidoreductase [Burkholderiaceae bacterium]